MTTPATETTTGAAPTDASQTPSIRRATAADLPSIQSVITAAYAKYLTRMDRPPGPLLRDHAAAVDDGTLWVTGNLAIYTHLGYRETARRTDGGYRRVFMEKALPG